MVNQGENVEQKFIKMVEPLQFCFLKFINCDDKFHIIMSYLFTFF